MKIDDLRFEVPAVMAIKELYGKCDALEKFKEVLGEDFDGTVEEAVEKIKSHGQCSIPYADSIKVAGYCASFGCRTKNEVREAVKSATNNGLQYKTIDDVLKALEIYFSTKPNYTKRCLTLTSEERNALEQNVPKAAAFLKAKGVHSPDAHRVYASLMAAKHTGVRPASSTISISLLDSRIAGGLYTLFPKSNDEVRVDIVKAIGYFFDEEINKGIYADFYDATWNVMRGAF